MSVAERSQNLLKWTTELKYSSLPPEVVARTKALLLDTIACCVAGQSHPAVQGLVAFAKTMGPTSGPCELFFSSDVRTSAAFAVMVNGAASHVVEQDDLHNAGMMHPVRSLH
jgi:2-methylcitrate dehydratase PrpD